MMPAAPASIAPWSEEASQGCTTAVGRGPAPQRAISRSSRFLLGDHRLIDASRAVEIVIIWIGIGLQLTAKILQHRFWMFSTPVGGEGEPDGGLRQSAMRAIINGVAPQPRGLCFAIAG